MSRLLFGSAFLLGLALMASPSHAQFGGSTGSDPFSQYYGYYVPQQQSFHAQISRGAVAGLNVNAADRRASALSQRAAFQAQPFSAYDPASSSPTDQFSARRPMRPPTLLLPGQPSLAVPHRSFSGRTGNFYMNRRTGLPGTAGR
jgi:hypothetical protein